MDSERCSDASNHGHPENFSPELLTCPEAQLDESVRITRILVILASRGGSGTAFTDLQDPIVELQDRNLVLQGILVVQQKLYLH